MNLREPPAVSCTATQRFEDNTGATHMTHMITNTQTCRHIRNIYNMVGIIYFIGTDDGRSLSYSNPAPELISVRITPLASLSLHYHIPMACNVKG